MHVGVLRVEYRLRRARSLKEKRGPLRSLRDRVQHRFGVSIAEVDGQDSWQRAVLGVAVVGASAQHVAEQLTGIRRYMEADAALECTGVVQRLLEPVDGTWVLAAGANTPEAHPAEEEPPEDLLHLDLEDPAKG